MHLYFLILKTVTACICICVQDKTKFTLELMTIITSICSFNVSWPQWKSHIAKQRKNHLCIDIKNKRKKEEKKRRENAEMISIRHTLKKIWLKSLRIMSNTKVFATLNKWANSWPAKHSDYTHPYVAKLDQKTGFEGTSFVRNTYKGIHHSINLHNLMIYSH